MAIESILDTIENKYEILFLETPEKVHLSNNKFLALKQKIGTRFKEVF